MFSTSIHVFDFDFHVFDFDSYVFDFEFPVFDFDFYIFDFKFETSIRLRLQKHSTSSKILFFVFLSATERHRNG